MNRKANEPAAAGSNSPASTDAGRTPQQPGQQVPESDETIEPGVQESATHGFREDDALKRIVKQHPQKGIPQVEGVEPKEAPPRE